MNILKFKTFYIVICLMIIINNFSYAINDEKRIFILHSYNPEYKWTKDIERGIKSAFSKTDNLYFDIEYMNCKKVNDKSYYETLYNFYLKKYKNIKFDIIIASDNDSLEFMKIYHKKLFGNTPVVFCGINREINVNNDLFHIIYEKPDYIGTINLVKKLSKNIKNIVVLTDKTKTGIQLQNDVKKIANNFNYEFKYIQESSIKELENKLNEIDKESIILFLLTAVKNENGFTLLGKEISKYFRNKVDIPMYSTSDLWLGNGIIGGKMITGFDEGKIAGEYAKNILDGKDKIKLTNNSKFMFDFVELEKFNIDNDLLPKNSILINTPQNSVNIEKDKVYTIFGIIFILFLIIIITIYHDLLTRIKAKKNMKESEDRYKILIDLLPEGIVIHNENEIFYANKEALKLLKIENENEIKKYKVDNFFAKENIESVKEIIGNLYKKNDKNFRYENKLINTDGNEVDIEFNSAVIKINGKKMIISVLRDMTERKQAEKLKYRILIEEELRKKAIEAANIKTEIFSNFSHELKTPLNIILGTIQLIEAKFKDEIFNNYKIKNKNPILIIKQNCFRLLRLVNNIIDSTRIESGYYKLNLKNVNIVSLVEDISLSVAEHIEQNGIELVFDTDIEEKILACDPDKIERIILNLLSNAVKFTNPGGYIHVLINDLIDKVKITIKDSGIGIPEENLKTILERFSQVDKHHYRNKNGSGIGLSLVNSLIEMHEGNLTINSKVNQGSEFIIELPVKTIETEDIDDKNLMRNSVERICIEFSDIYS